VSRSECLSPLYRLHIRYLSSSAMSLSRKDEPEIGEDKRRGSAPGGDSLVERVTAENTLNAYRRTWLKLIVWLSLAILLI
jgi:hypothetical protein